MGDLAQRFSFRYDGPGRLATLFGIGPGASWVAVSATNVTVHMGWAFHAVITRDAIRSAEAEPDAEVASIGVHGWNGRWLVNGSADGIVKMSIAPACRARTAVFPLKVHTLRVSLTDPAAFVEAVQKNENL